MNQHSNLRGAVLLAFCALSTVACAKNLVRANAEPKAGGNVVFLHPDGLALNHWDAARSYFVGPDGLLNWDQLPQMAVYRGHMSELLTGTSNGGATVHAFGYRVEGLGSFGRDGDGNRVPPTDRPIMALSGFPGSILREAANQGHPTGLVNDGNIGEPGTGAFAAEVGNRNNWDLIALQIIAGRDQAVPARASRDRPSEVILGGGERNFLPVNLPRCTPAQAGTLNQGGITTFPLTCMVHTLDWSKPSGTTGPLGIGRIATPDRLDGRNLLQEAADAGYLVIRTRAEFQQVRDRLAADPAWQPRILGLFAAHHTFNDRNEEELIASRFVDARVAVTAKSSNLVLWGNPLSTDPGFNPPQADEMVRVAMQVLTRHSTARNRPYFLVAEPESTDNFPNGNNAIATLMSSQVADRMIGVVREAMAGHRRGAFRTRFPTTVITAADSNASGMQLVGLPTPMAAVPTGSVNPAAGQAVVNVPTDGMYGRGTASFAAEPDQLGTVLHFAIAWTGTPDFAGGVLARAATNRSEFRHTVVLGGRGDRERGFDEDDFEGSPKKDLSLSDFSARFDNTDVYRFMYFHLFGELLPPSRTEAPTRR